MAESPEPSEPRFPGGPPTPDEIARSQANWAAAMERLGIALKGMADKAGTTPPKPPSVPPTLPASSSSPLSPNPAAAGGEVPANAPNWVRAIAALGNALGTGTLRQLNTNPALGMLLGAGFLQSRNARLGLAAVAAGRLATRGGRARVRKGVRIAGRALGLSKGTADKLGRVAAVGGAVGGVAIAAVAFTKAIQSMTEESMRFAGKLAEVSGSMAAVMAERNVREILRGQRQGERVAGTTRELANAEQNLKDQLEPIVTLWTNIKNTVLAEISQGIADLLQPVTWIAEQINKLAGKDPEKMNSIAGALVEISEAAERARAAGRPEFARAAAVHRP